MIKRILLIAILLLNIAVVSAQQYTAKNLIGRWQSTRIKERNMAFFTDSTGAFLAADGFLRNRTKYKVKADKDIIAFDITAQLDSKNPNYDRSYFKFINDSVFITTTGGKLPNNADTSNQKVEVYKRVKQELPGTAMRQHNYQDLIGLWKYTFGKTKSFEWELNFVDENTVLGKNHRSGASTLKYVVDFNKQPMTIDFYKEQELVEQAFFYFPKKNVIYIQYFKPNKRPDHFKSLMFGVKAALPLEKQTLSAN